MALATIAREAGFVKQK
uniref:Uncharacterized protein n=1 Tax=Anguilla anguilla TaxID=7936 RepID=A0A0E9UJJ2_ANGAN